jgi:hypothetical protein
MAPTAAIEELARRAASLSSIVLLAVLASALALVLSACGADGDTQAPTTTVSDQLVRPTPAEEDEVDEEENDGDQKGKKKEKRSGKDRGKRDADGSD